jgi:hypothetical protein
MLALTRDCSANCILTKKRTVRFLLLLNLSIFSRFSLSHYTIHLACWRDDEWSFFIFATPILAAVRYMAPASIHDTLLYDSFGILEGR